VTALDNVRSDKSGGEPVSRAAASGWFGLVFGHLTGNLPELLAMSLFINLMALAAPLFVTQVYDRVIYHAGLTTLQALVAGMACVLIFDFLLRQARSRVLQSIALKIDIGLGRRVFEKLAHLPLGLLEARPSHSWQFLFRDLEMVRNTVSGASLIVLIDLPFIILFVGLVSWLAPPLTWVFLSVCVAFVLLAAWNAITVRRAAEIERRNAQQRDRLVSEIIQGRTIMKAMAMNHVLQPRWEELHAATIGAALSRGRRSDSAVNAGMEIGVLSTVALTSVGAVAILDQNMSVGALVAANLLASRFVSPLSQLVSNWRSYVGFRDSARRLAELLAEPSERQQAVLDMPRPAGRLQLDDVHFAYAADGPDAASALNGITARYGPGGLHAIVGANGSGKTTLLKVMQGLYPPSSGRVLLDDGDIAQFSRGQIAGWIGYVPQDCFLFAGNIRDNIARFDPSIDDARILAAAVTAGVHAFASDLPQGYATEVGEGGQRLSTGQRQRIAIARALVSDPPILLMDEPTGNLDAQAEENLGQQLRALARNHTIIIVTHSPNLLPICDSITMLAKGQIAMAGRADQVLPKLLQAHETRPAGSAAAPNPANPQIGARVG
jgi:ATP-binding cassette subfamily C protein LapB